MHAFGIFVLDRSVCMVWPLCQVLCTCDPAFGANASKLCILRGLHQPYHCMLDTLRNRHVHARRAGISATIVQRSCSFGLHIIFLHIHHHHKLTTVAQHETLPCIHRHRINRHHRRRYKLHFRQRTPLALRSRRIEHELQWRRNVRSPRSRRPVQLAQPHRRQRHDLRREIEEAEA
jgi:hypothetical protein